MKEDKEQRKEEWEAEIRNPENTHIGIDFEAWLMHDFTWWERQKINAKAKWKVFKYQWLWE